MKKLILLVVVVIIAGMTLTSCDRDTRKCYKLEYKVEIANIETKMTTYEWASANEIDARIEALKKNFGIKKISKSVALKHKTIEDCHAACDRDTRKCYKLEYKVAIANIETKVTTYVWASANEIDAQVESMKRTLGIEKISKSVALKHKTIEDCTAANAE